MSYGAVAEKGLPSLPAISVPSPAAAGLVNKGKVKSKYKPKPYEQMKHPGQRVQINVKVHAQTSTTMNIYSHALQKRDRQAADTLSNMIHRRVDGKKAKG